MQNEIERKFFVKEMPDLSGIVPLQYERYFLQRGNGVEERITRVNDTYKYEKKAEVSSLERTREQRDISKSEFEELAKTASEVIERERYDISTNPKIVIQVYKGRFTGLVRAEVEFVTEAEALAFVPPPWMGEEMTHLPIARDGKLLDVSPEELRTYIVVC